LPDAHAPGKLNGARVIVIGRNEFKLQKAKRMAPMKSSASSMFGSRRGGARTDSERQGVTCHRGVGLPDIWEKASTSPQRGTITLFGGCENGTSIKIDTRKLHYDERRIIACSTTPRTTFRRRSLISRCQIDVDQLITHEFPLG